MRSSNVTGGLVVLRFAETTFVERTLGWLRRDRHLFKGYERKVQTGETLIEVAMSVSYCDGWCIRFDPYKTGP